MPDSSEARTLSACAEGLSFAPCVQLHRCPLVPARVSGSALPGPAQAPPAASDKDSPARELTFLLVVVLAGS